MPLHAGIETCFAVKRRSVPPPLSQIIGIHDLRQPKVGITVSNRIRLPAMVAALPVSDAITRAIKDGRRMRRETPSRGSPAAFMILVGRQTELRVLDMTKIASDGRDGSPFETSRRSTLQSRSGFGFYLCRRGARYRVLRGPTNPPGRRVREPSIDVPLESLMTAARPGCRTT